jgi:transposase
METQAREPYPSDVSDEEWAVVAPYLALRVTPANEQNWDHGGGLAAAEQAATGERVEVAFVYQGDTGDAPAATAAAHSIRRAVVKLPGA